MFHVIKLLVDTNWFYVPFILKLTTIIYLHFFNTYTVILFKEQTVKKDLIQCFITITGTSRLTIR